MVLLKDTLEKKALVSEALDMYKMLSDKAEGLGLDKGEIATVYRELMTNLRGVSMRKNR